MFRRYEFGECDFTSRNETGQMTYNCSYSEVTLFGNFFRFKSLLVHLESDVPSLFLWFFLLFLTFLVNLFFIKSIK